MITFYFVSFHHICKYIYNLSIYVFLILFIFLILLGIHHTYSSIRLIQRYCDSGCDGG